MKVTSDRSVAAAVREQVLASEDRYWSIADFGASDNGARLELQRLVASGELQRVRRGLYWRGRRTRFGASHASHVDAARAELDDDVAVGAARWYAANLLGLSTQVAPVAVLAVSRRPPTGFERVRFVDRSQRTGRTSQQLDDFEVTILEALEAWDRYVELPPSEATDQFVDRLTRPGVHLDRLTAASTTEPPVVRERLRALLLLLGREDLAGQVPRARSASTRKRALAVMDVD